MKGEPTDLTIITAAILFLLSIVTGFRVSHLGRPYNTAVFTMLKLMALGAGVLSGIVAYKEGFQ
jgi:hypothetical protein